jgi:hypothetical protein
MNLSFDQRSSLEKGEPVRVEENGLECVIVRAGVFEHISNHAKDDWTTEEMWPLAVRTFDDADSAGPIA